MFQKQRVEVAGGPGPSPELPQHKVTRQKLGRKFISLQQHVKVKGK